MAQKIIYALLLLGSIAGLLLIANYGILKSERVECLKLQAQQDIPGFYYTEAEKDQCKAVAPETLN